MKVSFVTKKVLLRYLSEGSEEKQEMPQSLTAGVPTYFQIGVLPNKNPNPYYSNYFWYGGLSNNLTDFEDPVHRNYLSSRARMVNLTVTFIFRITAKRHTSKKTKVIEAT